MNPSDIINDIRKKNQLHIREVISSLVLNGPYNLLSELLLLQNNHIQTLFITSCQFISSFNIVDILRDFDNGALNEVKLETLLSADCMSRWNSFVFKDLDDLGLIHRLPRSPFESRDFIVHRTSPMVFLYFMSEASKFKERELIVWSRWNSKMDIKCANNYYDLLNKERSSIKAWQTLNYRNFAAIKEAGILGRLKFIHFLGLSDVPLEEIELFELMQRAYTLVSLLKMLEFEYCSNEDSLISNQIRKLTDTIVCVLLRIQNSIEHIDSQAFSDLTDFMELSLEEVSSDISIEYASHIVNKVFIETFQYFEDLQVGDWMLGILFALSRDLSLISDENITLFLNKFLSTNPSLDGIIAFLKLVKQHSSFDFIEDFLIEHLKKLPRHLSGLYRRYRKEIGKKIVHLVPLSERVRDTVRNQKNLIFPEFTDIQFPFLNNASAMNPLRCLIEMIQSIGLQKLALKINKHVLEKYFELFLTETSSFFHYRPHEEQDKEDIPIIRLLPIFPTILWEQFGFLISLAFVLNIKLPFSLDFEFFSAIFNVDERALMIAEIGRKIQCHSESSEKVRSLYLYIMNHQRISSHIVRETLMEIYFAIEKIHLEAKKPSRLKRFGELKMLSQKEDPELKFNDSIFLGFKALHNGIRSGINVEDYSVSELYKLIFN
jgi:hypothetical protein